MTEDPKARIVYLEAKIKRMECVADLRRKQKRELKKQIIEIKRGVTQAWKALYGENLLK